MSIPFYSACHRQILKRIASEAPSDVVLSAAPSTVVEVPTQMHDNNVVAEASASSSVSLSDLNPQAFVVESVPGVIAEDSDCAVLTEDSYCAHGVDSDRLVDLESDSLVIFETTDFW